jgi:hypothetical protein
MHTVFFVPPGWKGKGNSISMGIPECELHCALRKSDGTISVMVNQPQHNFNVDRWMRSACDMAIDYGAAIAFHCNTASQAIRAAKKAKRWLHGYERVALERLYDAKSRTKGGLN